MRLEHLLLRIANAWRSAGRHPRKFLLPWVAGLALAASLAWWIRTNSQPVLAAEPVGAAEVAEALERLPVVGSVLLTGAHPDDENNALLAYLARGLQLRTAYLSATRGDGGQNLLGTEQYEALGILRTEELLAARRLDGAEQFFAQAYDFGFSKSAEETLEKWGHEQVLADYVRVLRQFRPDIVISRFTGTPSDGHGHHQASGILTREAFHAASERGRFPEQLSQGLKPWQAKWLFLNQGGGGGRAAAPDSFTMTLGGFSPLYGEAFGDLGMQARSQHRSQGMGGAAGRAGVYTATFRLVDSAPPRPPGATPKDLFDGIDLTLKRFTALAGGTPTVAQKVEGIQKAIEEACAALAPLHPERVLPALGRGATLLLQLRDEIQQANVPEASKDLALFLLQIKIADFARAIRLAGGVRLDAVADTSEIVPGGAFQVTVSGQVGAPEALRIGEVTLSGYPPSWKIERLDPEGASPSQGSRIERKFRVTIPGDAAVSQPYWLVQTRQKDYFGSSPDPWMGAPHRPAILSVAFQFMLSGGDKPVLSDTADVVYRYTDRIYGERERPPVVVPAIGVWMEPAVAVFPTGARASRLLLVRLRNMAAAEQRGTLRLNLPAGWQSRPATAPFTLAKRGDEIAVRFDVTAPNSPPRNAPEKQAIQAVAEVGGQSYSTGFQIIDYPHIQARYWFRPAAADLLRLDVKVAPGLKVGYAMGSGDDVPAALKQLGVEVTLLTPEDLAFGDLKQFDAIVTGIRAYEVRKDLSSNHARLMDYVSGGGVMIVQYSRTGGFSDPLGPYPMDLGSNPRVAVEEAPVEILEPAHPLFHFPNEITAKDFDGWVQERGTYFMESWAPEYKPLLASNDPGEPSQKGGMLVASYGKGLYLYTGYVWFRQLPAGVPGAYRIFANLISLGKTPVRQRRRE